MSKKETIIGKLSALFCVCMWDISFIFSKSLMQTLAPLQLMVLRCIIAYVALWIIKPQWHFEWKQEIQFFLTALFGNTLYFFAENTALQLTQTSNVSILVTTAPLMTTILLHFLYKKQDFDLRSILAFLLSFIGVILVVLNGVVHLKLNPIGDLLSLAAALSWSIYSLFLLKCQDYCSPIIVTRKVMFYGSILALPFLAFEPAVDPHALLTLENGHNLIFLGLICSALCYVLWSHAIARIGAIKTNTYIYAIPLVTMVAGVVLLHETVTLTGIIGAAFVLLGMTLDTLRQELITAKGKSNAK
ncbi:DMT family transporter [Streptococcus gallolyticus]|nr:DMT family transporter [Streptococcus gallolyticus]MBY5040669.1 DMT family transporter [Streptococcus gallolyticus]